MVSATGDDALRRLNSRHHSTDVNESEAVTDMNESEAGADREYCASQPIGCDW